jgi:hypothetical protein
MQLTTKQAAKIFRKLKVVRRKSTHHIAGFVVVDGRKVLPVFYSHGNKDMKGPVPHRFRKSLRLSEDEFARLRDCTLSREDYHRLLRERGVVQ